MRALKFAIYIALLLAALLLGAPCWKVFFVLLTSGASYFPDIPFLPLWVPLGLLVAGYLAYFAIGAVLRLHIGLRHHVVVLVLFGAVLLARLFGALSPAADRTWKTLEESPPHWLMARAAGRLQTQLERRHGRSEPRAYPADPAVLDGMLRENGRLPPSGFRSHGLLAPVRLVVVLDAKDAVRRVRPGDSVGTLYYAVSADTRRYWITAVGLTKYPAGKPAIMAGPDRQAMVLQPVPRAPEEGAAKG